MFTLQDLFHVPGSDVDRVQRLEQYKAALAQSQADTDAGRTWIEQGGEAGPMILRKGLRPDRAELVMDNLVKGLSPDQVTSLSQNLASIRGALMADVRKDWTPTSPINIAPYDLMGPARFLVPMHTPLRNRIPRTRGQGTACEYRRILSVSNSGQASAQQMPFFSSATQTSTYGGPGNLTLNRPAKISYTGDAQIRAYVEEGLSDQVNWKTVFAALGFEDPRAQSRTALLMAFLMGEERAILYGRGTAAGSAGYLGPVSAPTISGGTATTGGSLAADTYHCYVVGLNGMGQTLASAVASVVTTGSTSTITITVTAEPAGAIHYALYVGDAAAGFANARFQRFFTGNTITITSFDGGGVLGVDADSSFSALAWDGFYAVQADPNQSGYIRRVNNPWSTTDPGAEITTGLVSMFTSNGATPDELWMTAILADSLGRLLRIGGANGAANGYRTTLQTGDGQVIMGAAVSGIVNPATGSIVDLDVHRFALPGAVIMRSTSVPIPTSEVDAPVSMRMVQDYMGWEWPTIQMSFDHSAYAYGTMIHQAPAWSGILLGLTNS